MKKCLIDQELLSMKNFEEYIPPDLASCQKEADSAKKVPTFATGRQHMVGYSTNLASQSNIS